MLSQISAQAYVPWVRAESQATQPLAGQPGSQPVLGGSSKQWAGALLDHLLMQGFRVKAPGAPRAKKQHHFPLLVIKLCVFTAGGALACVSWSVKGVPLDRCPQ